MVLSLVVEILRLMLFVSIIITVLWLVPFDKTTEARSNFLAGMKILIPIFVPCDSFCSSFTVSACVALQCDAESRKEAAWLPCFANKAVGDASGLV